MLVHAILVTILSGQANVKDQQVTLQASAIIGLTQDDGGSCWVSTNVPSRFLIAGSCDDAIKKLGWNVK